MKIEHVTFAHFCMYHYVCYQDVEANTVRLKEHGEDVLVLEKIPTNIEGPDGTVRAHYKYVDQLYFPDSCFNRPLC